MPANILNSSDLSANSRRRLLNLINRPNKNALDQKETLILDHFEKDNLSLKRVSSHNSFDLVPSFSSSSAALSSILSETSLICKNSTKETFFDKLIKEDTISKQSKESLFSRECATNNYNCPILQLNDSNQCEEARKPIKDIGNNRNGFLKDATSLESNNILPSANSYPSIMVSETSFITTDSASLKSRFQFHDCDINHTEADCSREIKNDNAIPFANRNNKIFYADDDNLFSDSSNQSIESDLNLISSQLVDDDFEKLTPCQKHKKFKNLLRNYEILKKKCEYSKSNMHRRQQRKKNVKKKSNKIKNLVKKISCLSF